MKVVSIALSSDHAGYEVKEYVKNHIVLRNTKVKDFGVFSSNTPCDYPDYAHKLAKVIESEEYQFGIIFCGSGNGVNMTVNKYKRVRAALCWSVKIAELARRHNNANVCSIPARFVSEKEALEIVKKFLKEDFEGGRHIKRVEKIAIK